MQPEIVALQREVAALKQQVQGKRSGKKRCAW